MKIINKIVTSKTPPKSTNVLWYNPVSSELTIFNDGWKVLSGASQQKIVNNINAVDAEGYHTNASITLTPDVYTSIVCDQLDVNFNQSDSNILEEYEFETVCNAITWNKDLNWVNDEIPVINSGKKYLFKIINGTIEFKETSSSIHLNLNYPNNYELWYTTTDNNPAIRYKLSDYCNETYVSGNIISDIDNNGMCVLTTDEDIVLVQLDDIPTLKSVIFPASVTDVQIRNCSNIESIAVANVNPVLDSREECNAVIETATNTLICGCQNTVIPNSVTSIGENVFSYCSKLTFITIPNSVTSIGYMAFNSCTSLTSVTIPNSVTSIGYGAFNSCTSLTSVTIGEKVTSIGLYAFSSCSSLTSITIPNSVTSIGERVFSGCKSLTSITIGNSVKSIGTNSFSNCNSITSIVIPDSVTSIGYGAFSSCSSLTYVVIGNGMTSMDQYIFSGCSQLQYVTIMSVLPPAIQYSTFNNCDLNAIYVPAESVEAYKTATNWSQYANKIQAIQ